MNSESLISRYDSHRPTSRSRIIRRLIATPICRILAALLLAALVAFGVHNNHVHAQQTRLVSPFGDDLGGTNDCTSPDQPCKTIQQAVNQSGADDLIELGPGTYFENVDVTQSVTIQGDLFTGSTVNGGGANPVFDVESSLTVTLNTLTITNGATLGSGAGILNNGSLVVIGSTINGNSAGASGGGVCNFGTLTLINSTVNGNSASDGGGVANTSTGMATIVNCTITANTAAATKGGALANASGGSVNLINSIFAGSLGGSLDVSSLGSIATNDDNLAQDGSLSPAVTGNPKLGPLQNNGGPTFTQALMSGSPAIDAGDDAVLGAPFDLTTDQRGEGDQDFPRKVCAHVDIGAYEFGAASPPTLMCPANMSAFTNPGMTTATLSFSATAIDPCTGPLTPTYKIGSRTITSPFAFPAGVTTVSVSATSSQGVTGMCSFMVTVTSLNICIQDDHTGDTLRFNSQTGQYVYTRCKDKFTLSGTGVAKVANNTATLTDSKSDRKISASFNEASLTGKATITLIPAPGIMQTITLSQTNPHATCACPL